jgi:hypothetical protein
MSPITPDHETLGQLRCALADAEDEFERCQYIDHWPSVERCKAHWRAEISRLNAEILRLESEDDDRTDRTAGLWLAGPSTGSEEED